MSNAQPDTENMSQHPLAAERTVAASTQNQALSALLFLYRDVLGREWDEVSNFQRAWRSGSPDPERLPIVLTESEVKALLREMEGTNGRVAHLLHGAGLRLSEALRLRGKDLDYTSARSTSSGGRS
jgi:integrase